MDMFSVFLRAQAGCKTLVLTHAAIGDDGANEVARFAAFNTQLLRLDLTGNAITAAGAAHLGEALRQNQTLESLVLQQNALGQGGDDALQDFLHGCIGSKSLKHLDLRNNGLAGPIAAAFVGELLRKNEVLTHLEASWNPFGPAGGQVLLEHIRQNATLFDCQLSGCGIAGETILAIAQLLKRNRISRGAKLEPGPYRVVLEARAAAEVSAPAADGGTGKTSLSQSVQDIGAGCWPLPGPTSDSTHRAVIVSSQKTEEFRERLLEWRRFRRSTRNGDDTSDVQELLTLLNVAQDRLDEEVVALDRMREHINLVTTGFEDRSLRYEADASLKRDALRVWEKEGKDLMGIRQRAKDALALSQEAASDCREELEAARRRIELEDARTKNDLATANLEREACARRLAEYTDRAEQQEAENRALRLRVERVRNGVVLPPA